MLGNIGRSGVVTSMSPWIYHWNWQSGQDENHNFRIKREIGNIRKGVDYLSGFQVQSKSTQIQKQRYAIGNFSKKYLSKIISDFEKLPYESYEKKRPKHKPTDSYFYVARQLAKCMMRSDTLNSHVYPERTEMTDPSSHVYSRDENKSKGIIVHENLLQSCSTDED